MNKKYLVTMTKEFCIMAKDETEAQAISIDKCADDSETLIPHNMQIEVEASNLPDSYFD